MSLVTEYTRIDQYLYINFEQYMYIHLSDLVCVRLWQGPNIFTCCYSICVNVHIARRHSPQIHLNCSFPDTSMKFGVSTHLTIYNMFWHRTTSAESICACAVVIKTTVQKIDYLHLLFLFACLSGSYPSICACSL